MRGSGVSEKHDAGSMEGTGRLSGYVTPITAWALSLGCCVGWGSLVMPGTTFLPMAGPMGTLIGFVIGTLVMVVIVVNYSYMIRKHPGAGGTFLYATEAFGYDHGFLAAWFLLLTYVAMLWANATALTLIVRNLVGGVFQFGIHYELAGFDVYLGEVLLSCAAILVFGLLCLRGRAAGILQSVFMALFCAGVLLCFVSVMAGNPDGINWTRPAFSPDRPPMLGIFGVVTLAPWAFVGFENVSHSSEEFTFSTKKIFPILLVTVVVGAAAYVLLTGIAASAVPAEYAGWPEYIRDVGNLSGVKGLPIFNAVKHSLGTAGTLLLGVTAFCAISTSLIGNMVAASRLLFALSREDMAPRCFGRLNGRGVPEKAVVAIMCVSFIIPFFGRTAIGWIVDVNTVGATIAYAYTSSAAWKLARGEGKRKNFVFGAIGMVLSALFVLYFIVGNALAAESYLILTGWSIAGFFYFRSLFQGDTHFRLGRSIVVWIVLLAMIFFTSLMWMVQTANKSTRAVAEALNENYQEELEKEGSCGRKKSWMRCMSSCRVNSRK